MGSIYQWTAQIVCFLIFSSLVQQLLGKSSFRSYIRLVMGVLLMLIILRPVLSLLTDAEQIDFSYRSYAALLQADSLEEQLLTARSQSETELFAEYERLLRVQTETLLEREGLHLQSFSVCFDEETQDGQIASLQVVAGNMEAASEAVSAPRITIDPIQISLDTEPDGEAEVDELPSPAEIRIKNLLADFYRLELNHINITIREESR